MFGRPIPAEVFTPRAALINPRMYVHRALHERRIKSALGSGKAIILYGDSGCGKSWLYKKVLSEEKIEPFIIDLCDCLPSGNMNLIFQRFIIGNDEWVEKEIVVKTKGGISPANIGLSVERESTQEHRFEKNLKDFLSWIRERSGRRMACIVFENLEHVGDNSEVMRQLLGLIMKVDDPEFAKFNVKIILVGVESSFGYLPVSGRRALTISNRLFEIPEIDRMTGDEAIELIHRGFVEQLGYKVHEAAACCRLLIFLSDRVPQYLQDLCLHVALWAEENGGIILLSLIQEAALDWIASFIKQSSSKIEMLFVENRARSDRTSQVIYAISRIEITRFDRSHVEALIRREFPESTKGAAMSISGILSNLAGTELGLLKRHPKTGEYSISDVKEKLILRSCLAKYPEESVELVLSGRDEPHVENALSRYRF